MRRGAVAAGAAAALVATASQAQERIDAASAPRVAPLLWIGRTVRDVAFAGTGDALWVHTSDGVVHASGRAQRTAARGAAVFPDAAPAAQWIAYATEREGSPSPRPGERREVRVVDPTGVALPAPAAGPDVERLHVSRDGSTLVVFGATGPARVFARAPSGAWTARGRAALPPASDRAALSRDGRQLVVAWGRDLQVFDTATGRRVRSLVGPRSWCPWRAAACPDRSEPVDTRWLDLCVRDDGAVVAVGGGRTRAVTGAHRLEVFTAGRGLQTVAELTGRLERARFSPDCTRVAAATVDGQGQPSLQAFTVADGDLLGQRLLPGSDVRLAWSPDGARLAIAAERAASVWDLARGEDAVVLPDGALGDLVDDAGRARALDAVAPGARAWLQAQVVGPIRYAVRLPERFDAALYARSDDGRRMARARGVTLALVDLAGDDALAPITLPYVVRAASLSPDGSRLALVARDRVEVRAVSSGAVQHAFALEADDRRVVWASRGDALAVVDARNGARAFDGATGVALQRLDPDDGAWARLPVAADLFARTTASGTLLWNARSGRSTRLAAAASSLQGFTPDGAYVCGAGPTGAVYRLRDGARVAEAPGAARCALSTSGGHVAWASSGTSTARVAPTAGGDAVTVPTGPTRALALSPDGAVLAAASARLVSLFDARTGRRLTAIRAGIEVDGLAFSPDGTLLAVTAAGRGGHVLHSAEVWGVAAPDGARPEWSPPARQARLGLHRAAHPVP